VKFLRDHEIACELYPTKAKMQKQMKYANDKNVEFVALVGEEEMNQSKIQLKDMDSGEQKLITKEELVAILK